jgi:phosphatidate cytidylyltransferase
MSGGSKYADLRTRTISAIVMLLIACVTLGMGGTVFQITLLIVGFCIMWEITGLSPSDGAKRSAISLVFAITLAAGLWLIWPVSAGILVALLIGYIYLLRPSDAILRCGLAVLSFGGLLTLASLRTDVGLVQTLWVIACVIASDLGGYFAGRTFGGPKLWPAVSPKKTWSGTIGGWVLAVVFTIVFIVVTDEIQWSGLIWAVLIAIFAQAGDLAESALKRRAGVKDSSNLIPGHGGFLDRFDGMLGAFFLVFLITIFGGQAWLF